MEIAQQSRMRLTDNQCHLFMASLHDLGVESPEDITFEEVKEMADQVATGMFDVTNSVAYAMACFIDEIVETAQQKIQKCQAMAYVDHSQTAFDGFVRRPKSFLPDPAVDRSDWRSHVPGAVIDCWPGLDESARACICLTAMAMVEYVNQQKGKSDG